MALLNLDAPLLAGDLSTALNHHYQLQKHQKNIVQTLTKNPPGH
jgi:hypothetical protein